MSGTSKRPPDMLATGDRVHYAGNRRDTGTVTQALLNGLYTVEWDTGQTGQYPRRLLVLING